MSSGQTERGGDRASVFYGEVPALVAAPAPLNIWHNGLVPMGDAVATLEKVSGNGLVEHEAAPKEIDNLILVLNSLSYRIDKKGNIKSAPGGAAGSNELLTSSDRIGSVKWFGWPGNGKSEKGGLQEAFGEASRDEKYKIGVVELGEEEYKRYYEGYCNQVLWPLFHASRDKRSLSLFRPDVANADWQVYLDVNRQFAQKVVDNDGEGLKPTDVIFVQDYQLLAAATFIRQQEDYQGQPIAHFLHIPVPEPKEFEMLPQHKEILEHMLDYDLLGFQTSARDRNNFIANVRTFIPEAKINFDSDEISISYKGRDTKVEVFPIAPNAEKMEAQMLSPKAQRDFSRLVDALSGEDYADRQIILNLGRLDYTKGFLEQLDAIDAYLEKYPEQKDQVTFIQIMQPSRENIEAYQQYRLEIDEKVDYIRKKWGKKVLKVIMRGRSKENVIAHMGVADLMDVDTLADGANLVPLEYAIVGKAGGLVHLGAGAGAAERLRNFVRINLDPSDPEAYSDNLHELLTMPEDQREKARNALYREVKANDLKVWTNNFIDALVDLQKNKKRSLVAAS